MSSPKLYELLRDPEVVRALREIVLELLPSGSIIGSESSTAPAGYTATTTPTYWYEKD